MRPTQRRGSPACSRGEPVTVNCAGDANPGCDRCCAELEPPLEDIDRAVLEAKRAGKSDRGTVDPHPRQFSVKCVVWTFVQATLDHRIPMNPLLGRGAERRELGIRLGEAWAAGR